jgi:hypothetical protein
MTLLRKASWIVFAAALLLPGAWAYLALNAYYKAVQPMERCGLPILGIFGVASIASGFLSLIAAATGWLDLRKIALPRPLKRWLELALLSVPAVLAASVVVLLSWLGQ